MELALKENEKLFESESMADADDEGEEPEWTLCFESASGRPLVEDGTQIPVRRCACDTISRHARVTA